MPYARQSAQVLIVALVVTMSILTSCSATNVGAGSGVNTGNNMHSQKNSTGPKPDQGGRRSWSAIHNWVYWLDNPDIQQIAATAFELAVIDYSADGSAGRAFTAEQISTLRTSGCQRRVVAYLSIGQAESYRSYWQRNWRIGSPSWLISPDPDWAKNYWVQYWSPEWQSIIYHYIDKIIAAGFDGIYLDRIDAYEEPYATDHEADMLRFVGDIASYARMHSHLGADFGVIVQNAEGLAEQHPDYVGLVTGIGREEAYVQATNTPTTQSARAGIEYNLDLFRNQGKLVLTVDYADQEPLIRDAYTRAQRKGYIPYVAQVDLNSLQINAGYEPVCHPPF